MSKNNKFTVDGKEYKVITVTPEIQSESEKHWSEAFFKALDQGAPLKLQVKKLLEQRNLLDETSDEDRLNTLRAELKELEVKLRKGVIDGKRMTKEQGRQIALAIRNKRQEVLGIGNDLNELFSTSAEHQANNERYQYYLYACTVNAYDGTPAWPTYEDFKKADSKSELVKQALSTFLLVSSGIDKDFDKSRYENQWLIKMGFVNENLQLIRSDGKLVDEDGRLVNEEGRFINEQGDFVDKYGNAIDMDGNLLEKDTWGVCPTTSEASEPSKTGIVGANTTPQS